MASVSLGATLVTTGVVVAQPSGWSTRAWPAAAATQVAGLAATRPAATVFADARYADWLLWEQPQLSGRIAYDIRFELFSRQHFDQLVAYQSRVGDDWRRAIDGHDVLVVDQSGSRTWFVHCARGRPTTSPTETTRSRFSLAAGSGPSDPLVTVVT